MTDSELFIHNYPIISVGKALSLYKQHGFGAKDLLDDLGNRCFYKSKDVFDELGY